MQQPTTSPQQQTEEERAAKDVKRQEQIRRNQGLIQLLDELEQEDPEDQRATWEFLKRALDEDRTSYRKLFL